MIDTQLLENAGFTKSEIKAYFALLELGTTTTGPIVERSGVASSKIYEILDKLVHKGLVSYVVEGKARQYEATDPARILDYLEEKEKEMHKQKADIEQLIPQLSLRRTLQEHKQDAAIYRGFKGLETSFNEALATMKPGDTICVSGVSGRSEGANRFFAKWNRERAKRHIRMRIIFDESARGQPQTKQENSPLSEMRFTPKEVSTPAAVNIYNDRILIFPAETDEPLIIAIYSKDVATSFRAQFDMQWNQQGTILSGAEGPRHVLRDIVSNDGPIYAFGINNEMMLKHAKAESFALIKDIEDRKREDRIIFSKTHRDLTPPHNAQIRTLPQEYLSPVHVEIYADKVAIIDWTAPITTILFDKKEIAEAYRKHFELLWKIAQPKTI